ncbi:hypothetical protein Rs2_29843 [Raphanus sativus]|nr:hypothetical protein Rs2_29843 [Raphanus sativus]
MNIGKGVPVPECPIKTLMERPGSALKGQSDKEKYEKAKNLTNNIDNIRATFTKTFTSKDVTKKQIDVTTYLIDKLAVRTGNEKDHEECVASQRNDRARDKCQKEKWKTVNGEDLLRAMSTLDFENYLESLKAVPCEIKFMKHNVDAVSLQWCDAFKQKQKASQQNIYFEKARGGDVFLSEEEIRARSNETLENEDIQQLMRWLFLACLHCPCRGCEAK